MNIFNLVMKALDPTVGDGKTKMIMHPETDTSQITDFAEGVRDNLLSSALAATITTLTSDSLFAKMVKLVLTATGMRYSLEQNGYICFGALFGGLIIQWGIGYAEEIGDFIFAYPLAMLKSFVVLVSDLGEVSTNPRIQSVFNITNTNCTIKNMYNNDGFLVWIVGKS